MRSRFPVALPLAACLIGGAAGPAAADARLSCPATDNPQVLQLCQALAEALAGPGVAGLSGMRLRLWAESPRPDILTARLAVHGPGGLQDAGERVELSVMDRAAIPASRIRSFATQLLEQAAAAARDR